MPVSAIPLPAAAFSRIGLSLRNAVHYQLPVHRLVRDALRLEEGSLTSTGALAIRTGKFTGRSPKDRFIVKDSITSDTVNWNEYNLPVDAGFFDLIFRDMMAYANSRAELWVRDCEACADPRYRLRLRVINESPAANLFAYNMFLRPAENGLDLFEPDWHLIAMPSLQLDPARCGTRGPNAVVISFSHKMILIAGTGYTGEIKKAVFTILNYLLPLENDVLPMHCSANIGAGGDTALFFGLSGTGKTTLSADPGRRLIGDDEHGWSDTHIFNFEGGCYAKTINLQPEKEPQVFGAIGPGALLENVVFFPGTDIVDYSNALITENTRVSYPLYHIPDVPDPSLGSTPRHIFFLTCDAYGVLPPVSRLDAAQAMYQFIAGYTAKVAGTEAGVTEPRSTFSSCFGAPFLPLAPAKYASMLGKKLRKHAVKVWLVNTGWTGGAYGEGSRIPLSSTRRMVDAVLKGELDSVPYAKFPLFGFDIPLECPGVPAGLLNPRDTWMDKDAYDKTARQLAEKFIAHFDRSACGVDAAISAAAPVL